MFLVTIQMVKATRFAVVTAMVLSLQLLGGGGNPFFVSALSSLMGSHSFQQQTRSDNHKNDCSTIVPRRVALTNIGWTTILPSLWFAEPALALSSSSVKQPLLFAPEGITTVVLDSPESQLGIRLQDTTILLQGRNNNAFVVSVVRSLQPGAQGAAQGVQEGMIVLSFPSSASVVQKLQSGPYPLALQFYNLAVEDKQPDTEGEDDAKRTPTPLEALEAAEASAQRQQTQQKEPEPALSSRGTGLKTKTIRKGSDCSYPVKRGDTVTIAYEARVASPGGPIYDSTAERGGPVTFVVGDGQAINGVDIGIGGMCQGEIRELDIPNALGYGRMGSARFDVPGQVRLWWSIELLESQPGGKKRSTTR